MTNAHASPVVPTESVQSGPRPDAAGVVPDTKTLDEDIPVSLYESRFNKPYAFEYFGLNKNILTELDKGMMEKIRTIEEFALSQIQDKGYEDSKKSYNRVVNGLMKILGVESIENPKQIID